MKATIVTIGDEILIGQIVDTNSGFIAKSLDKIGIEVVELISISDNKKHILDTFAKLQNKVELVIITGGLGPTKDDITKKTFCDYFEDELVVDDEVLAHVTQIIEGFYKRPITQLNIDQALVPSKATILKNANGTAPGMWMQKENTVFISLPGVPYEMKEIIDSEIIPRIVSIYKRPYIIHKTILTYGVGESILAEQIEYWENDLPEFLKLAYLPSPGKVRLRLSARGTDKEMLEKTIDEKVQVLSMILGDIIVGFDEGETIEVVVGKIMAKHQKTISLAESCTGGKISQMLTSVAGASQYFQGSIICYSKEIKIKVLHVSEEMIKKHSVVSAEVAEALAVNVRKLLNTDYGLAITGNAGPTTDETLHKVGTVFIALATPNGVFTEAFNFGQPRQKVIDRAANKSLEILHKEILNLS